MSFVMPWLPLALTGLAAWVLWAACADDWRLTPRGQPMWVRIVVLGRGYTAVALCGLLSTVLTCALWVGVAELVQPNDRPVLAVPILACGLLAWRAVVVVRRSHGRTHTSLVGFQAVAVGTLIALPICLEIPGVLVWGSVVIQPVSWFGLYRAMSGQPGRA